MDPIEDGSARFEIFAIISLDNFDLGQTQTFVKKRLKRLQKNQWFKFSDGAYQPIEETDVLENHFPILIFYKRLNFQNNFFMFNDYANIPTEPDIVEEK